jgi:hypothetical protein
MNKSFVIQKGEIIFGDEIIQINDKTYKWERYTSLIFGIAAIFYALTTLYEYLESNGSYEFGLVPFTLIIALGIPAIVYRLKHDFSTQLKYSEVKKVIIHENPLGLLVADFMLVNSKKRHVVLDINRECSFERSSLTNFVKELKERNIETVIR